MPSNPTLTGERPPRHRDGLRLAPDSKGARLLISDADNVVHVRLAGNAAELFMNIDGRSTVAELANRAGITLHAAGGAIGRFESLGLLADEGAPPVPTRQRAWRIRPPATVQVSLRDPEQHVARLAARLKWLASAPARGLAVVVAIVGVVAFCCSAGAIEHDVGQQIGAPGLAVAIAVFILASVAHELSHAVALSRAGGAVHRLGAMVFYGMPALFCDVSDAWALERRARVGIALAGVRAQLLVAALASVVVTVLSPGDARIAASMVAVASGLLSLINLCPFVKFDGYIALVGWLDEPFLRARSMAMADAWIASRLLGGPPPTDPVSARLLYGFACRVAGPVLVVMSFLMYQPVVLASLGRIGGVAVLAVELIAAVAVARSVRGALRSAGLRGAGRLRRLMGALLVLIFLVLAGSQLRVPNRATTVYARVDGGTVMVLTSETLPVRGGEVELHSAGLFRHPLTALAVVCGPPKRATVPLTAGLPVRVGGPKAPRRIVALCVERGAVQDSGLVTIRHGHSTLLDWCVSTLWDRPVRRIVGSA